jgi:hypothetical protein
MIERVANDGNRSLLRWTTCSSGRLRFFGNTCRDMAKKVHRPTCCFTCVKHDVQTFCRWRTRRFIVRTFSCLPLSSNFLDCAFLVGAFMTTAILAVVMNAQVQKKDKCRRKRQAEMHMRLNLIPIPIRKDERDKAVAERGASAFGVRERDVTSACLNESACLQKSTALTSLDSARTHALSKSDGRCLLQGTRH